MIKRLVLFLIFNFGGLALGSIFTNVGVASSWYENLSRAPWTPPGWMFGAAWFFIMVCFSFYLALALPKIQNTKSLGMLFGISWILNVSWNPVFFYLQQPFLGLLVIVLLTLLIWSLFLNYFKSLKWISMLLLPYGIWLLIATSLNLYIVLEN